MEKCFIRTNLPLLLKRKGITLYKLCSYTGVKVSTAYRWLRTDRVPVLTPELLSLSRHLGVGLRRLVFEDLRENVMFNPRPLVVEIPEEHPAYEHEMRKRGLNESA